MFRHLLDQSRGGMVITTCGIPIENNTLNPTANDLLETAFDETKPLCADCERIFAESLGFTKDEHGEWINKELEETLRNPNH